MLLSIIAGTAGGAIGWFMQESLINYNSLIRPSAIPGQPPVLYAMTSLQVITLMACVGGITGLLLGAVDGLVIGDRKKAILAGIVGFFGGTILGLVGYRVGSAIFNGLGGTDGTTAVSFAQNVVARGFGWAPMGLGVGAGAALSTMSSKRIGQGAAGGFLGGFFGGIVFNFASLLLVEGTITASNRPVDVGAPGRAIGFTAIGALTGLFIGLVQELTKDAWVKVLAGRNEGKDFQLERTVNIMGRDERCSVPLFGDSSVGIQHAAIQLDPKTGRRSLQDAGTPAGTAVNGQQLPAGGQTLLQDGDIIQIGQHQILFRERATARAARKAERDVPRNSPVGAAPLPSHLCPYCGGPRDASGNCRCTPGAYNPAGPLPNETPQAASGIHSSFGTSAAPQAQAMPNPVLGSAVGRLVCLDGPSVGQVFDIMSPNVTVGREAACNLVVSGDTTVSRNHAQISAVGGTYQITDCQSANGTFLNGQRVTTSMLKAGDEIRFGNSRFRFE